MTNAKHIGLLAAFVPSTVAHNVKLQTCVYSCGFGAVLHIERLKVEFVQCSVELLKRQTDCFGIGLRSVNLKLVCGSFHEYLKNGVEIEPEDRRPRSQC